jgi:hypothetical protein
VIGSLVHTGLGSSSLVAHVLPYPPPPPCKQLCTRSCSNKHTQNTHLGGLRSRSPDGWDQIPRWAGGWFLHQPPWSFGFDSQTRGTRENRAPPCVKVPGSSLVSPREQLCNRCCSNKHTRTDYYGQTRPRLVVSRSTCPPLPPPPPTRTALSSTLHIRWGLCDRICQILVCRDRYGLGGRFGGGGGLLFILGLNLGGVGPVRGLRGGRRAWCEE